jgi:transcription antitermination factor NusB
MGKRRKARELATQVLFHMEFSPGNPDEAFHLICENYRPSESIRAFSKRLVCGVCENKETLDELITQSSQNWRLERMSRVDRCILRLGVFELLFMEDIPPKVSIDEAVELGKLFGTEDSGGFINGILDNVFSMLKDKGKVLDKVK